MYLHLIDGRTIFSAEYSADKIEIKGKDIESLKEVIVNKDDILYITDEICKKVII